METGDFGRSLVLVRGSHEHRGPVVVVAAVVLRGAVAASAPVSVGGARLRATAPGRGARGPAPGPDDEEDEVEVERRPAAAGRPPVEVRRSPRRRRSASAHAQDGVVVVRLPSGLPHEEEERLVRDLVAKVTGRLRADALGGDEELERRARVLAERYLDGIGPTSVRWTSRMARRWGSCTPSTGEIRISREVAAYPSWVRDYVLIHELAHLQAAGHDERFERLVARYPRSERARGWLEGHVAGRLAAATPTAPDEPATDPVATGG